MSLFINIMTRPMSLQIWSSSPHFVRYSWVWFPISIIVNFLYQNLSQWIKVQVNEADTKIRPDIVKQWAFIADELLSLNDWYSKSHSRPLSSIFLFWNFHVPIILRYLLLISLCNRNSFAGVVTGLAEFLNDAKLNNSVNVPLRNLLLDYNITINAPTQLKTLKTRLFEALKYHLAHASISLQSLVDWRLELMFPSYPVNS